MQITHFFVVWALSMYALYVVSVFAGDGLALPSILHMLFPRTSKLDSTTKGTKGGGGFDWARFRDTLLRRQGDRGPIVLMLDADPAEDLPLYDEVDPYDGEPSPEDTGGEGQQDPGSSVFPLGTVAEGDEEAPLDSPAIDDYACFAEDPDLDVPMGSAEDFLPGRWGLLIKTLKRVSMFYILHTCIMNLCFLTPGTLSLSSV